MRTAIVAALVGVALVAVPADAQRRCTKGIPCGNSCIAANKVCRIGTSPAPREHPAPREPATSTQALIGQSAAVRDSALFEWVGSVDGSIYYRSTCVMATKLWPQERVYFRNESEAVGKGYRRSRVQGC